MKRLIASLVLVLCMVSISHAIEVSGVNIPDTLTIGQEKLVLNGVGLRKKFVVKVYLAGLYLKEKSSDANAIIQGNEPMALVLHFIHSEVPKENLIEAWNEGFQKSAKDRLGSIQKEIDQFNAIFTGPAKKGDVYLLLYTPQNGVEVRVNNDNKGTIKGLEFKKALFGIWIGDDPVSQDLKKGLLGL